MIEPDKSSLLKRIQRVYVNYKQDHFTDRQRKIVFLCLIIFIIGLFFYVTVYIAPDAFPEKEIISIEEGVIVMQIAEQFEKQNVVRSAFWLKNIVILLGGEKAVFAGDYYFDTKKNIFRIARMITTGQFDLTSVSVTVPEGVTNNEMAVIFERKLSVFDKEKFLLLAESKEGYLFPDTYLFLPNAKAKEVIKVLEKTFIERVGDIRKDIIRFGKPLNDVVIMASLLEKEARTEESRRMIAGILWKRISIGMLLQVDAVFPYIINKNTFQLTLEDLDIDSPYNTYRYKGLPAGPIANPGLDALKAAVTPIESDYLFYLSDMEGNMHYSRTFEEHKFKKQQYLN